MLFAQAELISPWVKLVFEAGAFGLLVYIVVVAYPRSAKETRDEREARERAAVAERAERDTRYTGALNHMTQGLKESTETTSKTFEKCAERIEKAVLSVCRHPDRGA